MSDPVFWFVDDAYGDGGDAQQYSRLLTKDGLLRVLPVRPDRAKLLVPEAQIDGCDGFILDINLGDQADDKGDRFVGTGAGIAQDLRLLQALGGADGQKARPIVRLCAPQVFQKYIAGDNSTDDIFDIGLDKEQVADIADAARLQIAALAEIYTDIAETKAVGNECSVLLGLPLDEYSLLHSHFRAALELEASKKVHEFASFFTRHFLRPPGLLMSEELLGVRLGVDISKSQIGWGRLKEFLEAAAYEGAGASGFPRWWSGKVLTRIGELSDRSLARSTSAERIQVLEANGFDGLIALQAGNYNPGDMPWSISSGGLRLPVDPDFAYQTANDVSPWLDTKVWCFEEVKRNKSSPSLTPEARARFVRNAGQG